MFHTLFSKLAITLFILLLLIGILWIQGMRHSAQLHQQEITQKLNYDLAMHIVAGEPLLKNKKINKTSLEHLFQMLMVINPRVELYLLDTEGKILSYYAPDKKIIKSYINLQPIKKFIAGNTTYPFTGDDPKHENKQNIFSASAIEQDGKLQGYLYAILASERYENLAEMLDNSFILRNSAYGIISSLLLLMLFGLGVFTLLTRRIKILATLLQQFSKKQGQTSRYVPSTRSRDEIDQLGLHFNDMADRIEQQLQELTQNDQKRRELVANVSHDLRTPLATMQGYLETLKLKQNSLDDVERAEYLDIAIGHSQRLGQLVNELFELAKLDSIDTVLYSEPFSLTELMQDITQQFSLRAKDKNITLRTDFKNRSAWVHGDIAMIHRVLENLLENALRHTPENGAITLSFNPNGNQALIKVADTGAGIPESDIPHVFDRLYQVEKSRSIQGNSGLGLAIVKRIIELHGGTIKIESKKHEGTTFSFEMPLHSPA
ncbi:MAG: ATP-binding protein [Acidiferrobacterales bacterium]